MSAGWRPTWRRDQHVRVYESRNVIEPWERDWSGLADWSALPRFALTIPALLAHAKANHPDRELLVLDEHRTTYGEIEFKSAILARQLLSAGIGKGCHVGVMLPNDETFLVSWLAITR